MHNRQCPQHVPSLEVRIPEQALSVVIYKDKVRITREFRQTCDLPSALLLHTSEDQAVKPDKSAKITEADGNRSAMGSEESFVSFSAEFKKAVLFAAFFSTPTPPCSSKRSRTFDGNSEVTILLVCSADCMTIRCLRSTQKSYNRKTTETKTKIATAAQVKMIGLFVVWLSSNFWEGKTLTFHGQRSCSIGTYE